VLLGFSVERGGAGLRSRDLGRRIGSGDRSLLAGGGGGDLSLER
jgi:hypothetical protein